VVVVVVMVVEACRRCRDGGDEVQAGKDEQTRDSPTKISSRITEGQEMEKTGQTTMTMDTMVANWRRYTPIWGGGGPSTGEKNTGGDTLLSVFPLSFYLSF